MIRFVANWAMALYLSDKLRHSKIDFKSYVTDRATVIFEFSNADMKRVKPICKGLAKMEDINNDN